MNKLKATRKPLIFKSYLLDLIACGKKTLTLRLWKNPRIYNKGDIIIATNYQRKIPIEIINCYKKQFNEITLKEIKEDGFNSKEELLKAIKMFYRNFNEGIELYIIKFKLYRQ